jgi:hypothetical protein
MLQARAKHGKITEPKSNTSINICTSCQLNSSEEMFFQEKNPKISKIVKSLCKPKKGEKIIIHMRPTTICRAM